MAQQASPSIRFGSVRLLQDAPLGTGAYGQVCKATLGELPCAAKVLHPTLVDPSYPRNRALFEQECRFLSEIRHPNIVQYLGVAHDPITGLPILLMELMDDSLTHFLEQSEERLPYHVQVNISHDIALALAFLHDNRILHRDLSSNNVLLIGAGIRAKVTDFGMSKLTELNPRMTGLTKCPGTPAYMSPEALSDPPVYTEKLDCFQEGVLMIQTITRKFPNPSDATRKERFPRSPTGWVNIPVPEAERRHNHLSLIPRTHPILPIATDCLKDKDTERPSAQQICHRLSALKEAPQYGQSLEARGERDGEVQERELLIQQLRQENEEKEGEIGNLRGELQRTEEEKQRLSRRLDLTNVQIQQTLERRCQVEDQLRDEIHQLRESNTRVLQEKDEIIREKDQHLHEKDQRLQEKDATIRQLQQSQQFASYTCQVSGPGLQSATANHPTHVLVELTDSSGRPCSLQQNITAELQPSQATPTSTSRWPWSKKLASTTDQLPAISAAVAVISPSRYEVSYTAVSRGQHKLHVRVNGREINGSPFTMTVYPDPTQLGRPVRVVTGMRRPYGIAFNSRGEMIVSEQGAHKVSVFDVRGQRVRTFGSYGDRPEQMKFPTGIAVDDMDNIYVCNLYKLQKFTNRGELIKCVGQQGRKEGEFDIIRGLTVHREQVYVCDHNNHRIQVFDLDLNFIRSIGSHGKGRGEFNDPHEVKFDTAGNMYVADLDNDRVQVMDSSGQFIRVFGQEGEGKLDGPSALYFADKYVYVSDFRHHRIVVYETSGQFVTSFGKKGQGEGEFKYPYCITSCADGFIYVCDKNNNRVQIFYRGAN